MKHVLLAALAALAVALLPATASARPNQERHLLSVGHVDAVAPVLDRDQLRLVVHDDTGDEPVTREVDDVLFHAKPESGIAVPDLPAWSFLGEPGDTVYYLPMTQNPDLLWPGWSSETIAPGAVVDDELTWRLVSVDGPGAFHLFEEGIFGDPLPRLGTSDGWPRETTIGVPVHAHFSWTFAERGLYKLVFEVSGELSDGRALTSGPVEYRFFVGDLADLPEDTALTIFGLETEYRPGDTVTLTASQDPPTDLDHYHWFTRCQATSEWAIVGGESGPSWTFPAQVAHDGCEVQARLYDHGHEVVAESLPVTLRVRSATSPPTTGGDGGGGHVLAPAAPAPQIPAPAPIPMPVEPVASSNPPSVAEPVAVTAALRARKSASRRLSRTGSAAVACRLSGPGTCRVRAWVRPAGARKLGLRVRRGAKRITVGRGRASRSSAGIARVHVRLSRRASRAMRATRKTVRIHVSATAIPA